jgi:hypothetical protein
MIVPPKFDSLPGSELSLSSSEYLGKIFLEVIEFKLYSAMTLCIAYKVEPDHTLVIVSFV